MNQSISTQSTMSVGMTSPIAASPYVRKMPHHRQICWMRVLTIFAAISQFHVLEVETQADDHPLFDARRA